MPSRYRAKQLQMAIRRADEHIRRESEKALDWQLQKDIAQFNAWVLGWKGKPKFQSERYGQVTVLGARVYTSGGMGQIFTYVDQGTGSYAPGGSPYIIRPKNASTLAFKTGYDARTQPVAKANVGTARTSGPQVYAQSVVHPGIRPRKFAFTRAEKSRRELMKRLGERLSR